MKYENLMLRSLFVACLLVCTLVLGAMLKSFPAPAGMASSGTVANALLASPAQCALPADGVICPRQPG
ncbi:MULTISPECIES: hypothetical protein [Rhodanobacter]|uniref:Uncharacterized protein n=1 Tax=Rhodanobacter hydrolyticus TaxID=2250595 RepID=A0ABW8J7H3_9GAMM|nr:hypothetical protein [Rhodanobacter sp. 7MK24]MBD8882166.1 hypothetical protein [Rhodanobacter sp. 7MK24]